eukprot:8156553-Lingulodinium_polyedra.AAC.1
MLPAKGRLPRARRAIASFLVRECGLRRKTSPLHERCSGVISCANLLPGPLPHRQRQRGSA